MKSLCKATNIQSTKLEFDFQCHKSLLIYLLLCNEMVRPVSALATLCGYKPITDAATLFNISDFDRSGYALLTNIYEGTDKDDLTGRL